MQINCYSRPLNELRRHRRRHQMLSLSEHWGRPHLTAVVSVSFGAAAAAAATTTVTTKFDFSIRFHFIQFHSILFNRFDSIDDEAATADADDENNNKHLIYVVNFDLSIVGFSLLDDDLFQLLLLLLPERRFQIQLSLCEQSVIHLAVCVVIVAAAAAVASPVAIAVGFGVTRSNAEAGI